MAKPTMKQRTEQAEQDSAEWEIAANMWRSRALNKEDEIVNLQVSLKKLAARKRVKAT